VPRARYGADFSDSLLVAKRVDKERNEGEPFARTVAQFAAAVAATLGLDESFEEAAFGPLEAYAGPYGVVGDAERAAIGLTARTEVSLLDPVYTGRAMAGLIAVIRSQGLAGDDRALFWHTGGTPALFACAGTIRAGAGAADRGGIRYPLGLARPTVCCQWAVRPIGNAPSPTHVRTRLRRISHLQ